MYRKSFRCCSICCKDISISYMYQKERDIGEMAICTPKATARQAEKKAKKIFIFNLIPTHTHEHTNILNSTFLCFLFS